MRINSTSSTGEGFNIVIIVIDHSVNGPQHIYKLNMSAKLALRLFDYNSFAVSDDT